MTRAILLIAPAALALAGCMDPPAPTEAAAAAAPPPSQFQPAPSPIPLEVLTAVPPGTQLDQIVVSAGCYYVRGADGTAEPVMVLSPMTGQNAPYCGA